MTAGEGFRRWCVPWKERVCDEVWPFSHGTALRSRRYPDVWEYNCLRLDQPMETIELIAVAGRELGDCAHRLVESLVPMPDGVVRELRERGWIANPPIYMRHDARAVLEDRRELVEVDYATVRELRDIWHREDFGDHTKTEAFHAQARAVAELDGVRVIAAIEDGCVTGFALALPGWRRMMVAARSPKCSSARSAVARDSAVHSPPSHSRRERGCAPGLDLRRAR